MCDQSDITRYFSLQSTLALPIARYHGSSKILSKTNGHLTEPISRYYGLFSLLQTYNLGLTLVKTDAVRHLLTFRHE